MKTILITGINGFLGSHLAKDFAVDYNIIGLEYSLENLHRLKGYSFKVYSSTEDLTKIFVENEIYAVIHAATVYGKNNESIEDLITANITLPIKIYELANKHNTSKFLNTDSFFNNPKYNYSYLSAYTLSKQQVIEWLKIIKGKCELINMKLFHMYGGGDASSKFVSQIISSISINQPFVELTAGEQKRDFIFINDVVNAYKIVLSSHRNAAIEGMTDFEVGTGFSTSLREFILLVKELTKSNSELRFGALPYRENEIFDSFANNSKLRSLGWSQQFTLIEGLRKIIK